MSAARNTDPTTSHEAAAIDAPAREDIRHAIVRQFVRRPVSGYTDEELVDALAVKVKRTPQRIRTARAELTRLGVVIPIEEKYRTTNTGRRARVFKANV